MIVVQLQKFKMRSILNSEYNILLLFFKHNIYNNLIKNNINN